MFNVQTGILSGNVDNNACNLKISGYKEGCPCRKVVLRLYINFVENPQGDLFMTKYEGMLIARQDLGQSQVNDIVATLSEAIKKEGGEVVNVDNWGLKNLAYRIKKNRKGYYVVMNISAPANAIFEYERLARLNEDIIRFMTVKVDEFGSAKEEKAAEEQA